ncbi:hypothetical protein FB451DRAFT_355537 [Mycena latifolia]|nr:hypothetical protein FB451DRAFT_355537 [Mycena latifolia]
MSAPRTRIARGLQRLFLVRTCFNLRYYSSQVNVENLPHARRKSVPPHKVSTLIPSLLKPNDYLDVSRRTRVMVDFSTVDNPPQNAIRYAATASARIPFPDNTHGFLYYHSEPCSPPLEGRIRFRLTSNNSPSSFSGGEDLAAPSGFPWEIMLAEMALYSQFSWLAKQLVCENLVTREQLSRCQQVFNRKLRIQNEYTLFHRDSPFLVSFSTAIFLGVVGEETLHRLNIGQVFTAFAPDRRQYFPWTGSAIARFERCTNPKHAGRRVLHIRIVKILQPIACTVQEQTYTGRIKRPEEGQLLTVSYFHRPPAPWMYDIDANNSKIAAALRILWDNSREP